MSDPKKAGETEPQDLARLRQGIEQTQSDMSSTLRALEDKLDPADLREKAAAELVIVETHVKAAVKEQLHEARGILKEELTEAKTAISELMVTAKDTVIRDTKNAMNELMVGAKDTVIKDAKAAANEIILKTKDGVKEDILSIKNSVKRDVSDALTGAKTAARAATLGRLEDLATHAGDVMTSTRDTLVATVRQNPLPAAIAGVGIAWLLMNRSKTGRAMRHDAGIASGNAIGAVAAGTRSTVSGAVEGASHIAAAAVEGVSHLTQGAAQLGGNLAHSAGDLAHDARDSVSHFAHRVPQKARQVEQRMERTFANNPLAIGAAVVALGAVLGMSLPRTRREDAWMGGARTRIVQGAQAAAHDAAIAVRHLGEEAASTVSELASSSSSSSTT